MRLVQQEGFSYSFDPAACRDCAGSCCRGRSGNIWINAEEIERIAAFLLTNQVDVIALYLDRVGNRLTIRERLMDGDHQCVFFDPECRQCSIYPVRPGQCLSFPFWPFFRERVEELLGECPGIRVNG